MESLLFLASCYFLFPWREIQVAHCASPLLHFCMYFPDVSPQVQMVVLDRI